MTSKKRRLGGVILLVRTFFFGSELAHSGIHTTGKSSSGKSISAGSTLPSPR
jgi:hypothetical protein